jgi:membrane associated rhomboid family serine protease
LPKVVLVGALVSDLQESKTQERAGAGDRRVAFIEVGGDSLLVANSAKVRFTSRWTAAAGMSDCGPLNEPIISLPSEFAVLRAKTQRQAMDWALVLASQGIEPVIQQDAEGKWQLMIPAAVAAQAAAVIRQYRIENRHWHWRQPVLRQRLVFDWTAGVWVLLLGLFHWLSGRNPAVRDAGEMNSAAVMAGEWWRLFTATWLHADIAHLASNAGFGFLLLALALGRHGTGAGLLAAWLAGAAGNVVSMVVHGNVQSGLGASGVVMGALGLLAAQPRGLLGPTVSRSRVVFTTLAATGLLFALLGLSPQSDVAAHAGGFGAGVVLGWLLVRVPDLATNRALNLAAGLGWALLTLLTWARAMA